MVCIDGVGTNLRSKSFHEAYYGNLGDNTLPDQITGMKQVTAQNPWIDRVGIYGHSGGGNATATAMFTYPDYFVRYLAGGTPPREYEMRSYAATTDEARRDRLTIPTRSSSRWSRLRPTS